MPARVRPSIMPASSISLGISAKNPRMTQTTSERLKVEWARITASGVSVMPIMVNSRNIGTTTEIGGAMRVVRKKKNRSSLAANSCRANTYAAGTPTRSESSVVETATRMLLPTSGR